MGFIKTGFIAFSLVLLSSGSATGALPALIGEGDDAELVAFILEKLESAASDTSITDEPAVFISDEEIIKFAEGGYSRWLNVLIHVRDREKAGSLERTIPLGRSEEQPRVVAWTYSQQGSLRRLTDGDIRTTIEDGDDGRMLIVTFPAIRDGMVLGYSFATEASHRVLSGFVRVLSRPFHLTEGSIRVRSELNTTYRYVVHNLEKGFSQERLESIDGVSTDIRLHFRNIPVDRTCPFGLPRNKRIPILEATLRGRFIEGIERGWIYTYSWGQAAGEFDTFLQKYLDVDKGVRRAAKRAVGDAEDHTEMLRRLTDHIVGGFRIIGGGDLHEFAASVGKVLDAKAGTSMECMLLLYAMARNRDIPVDLLFTKTAEDGEVDLEYPSFNQFNTAVVRLSRPEADGGDIYVSIQPDIWTFGHLPANLLGADAALIADGAGDRMVNEFYKVTSLTDLRQAMRALDVCELLVLPGDPGEITRSMVEETIAYTSPGDTSFVTIDATGETDFYLDFGRGEDAPSILESHLEGRFTSVALSDVSSERGVQDGIPHAVLSGRMDLDPAPPAAMGDVWVLPPTTVFGEAFFNGWNADDCDCFYVPYTIERVFTWRHPLPDGWTDILPHAPLVISNKMIKYHGSITIDDGDLVITRRITLNPILFKPPRVRRLGPLLQRMTSFETTPVVVERGTGP